MSVVLRTSDWPGTVVDLSLPRCSQLLPCWATVTTAIILTTLCVLLCSRSTRATPPCTRTYQEIKLPSGLTVSILQDVPGPNRH